MECRYEVIRLLSEYQVLVLTDLPQESPVPGAVGSAEGPGWWKELEKVFYTD